MIQAAWKRPSSTGAAASSSRAGNVADGGGTLWAFNFGRNPMTNVTLGTTRARPRLLCSQERSGATTEPTDAPAIPAAHG
jgi:hypothetical protein